MRLDIDGRNCELESGRSILDAVKKEGLDSIMLSDRPLAAQIGGEVFNLRFTPKKDTQIHLLRYGEDMGRRVYERTLQFLFILAMRKEFPRARVCVRYSLGPGLFITVDGMEEPFNEEAALKVETEMRRLVRLKLPLERRRISIKEALSFYEQDGQADKAKLLKWRRFSYFDVYQIDGYMDYFYGEMAPDTSYADVFRVKYVHDGAVVLLMPRSDAPDVPSDYVNEALHDRGYADIADKIVQKGAKAVLVAGPSSSGKTTSAHRISTQLRLQGCHPVMLSLDDYYIDRDKIERDENGEIDLENINTLDIQRFGSDLAALIRGEKVEVPRFDFTNGKRAPEGRILQLHDDEPVIIEGIHGLNPMLLSPEVDESKIFRVYVSALTTLNLDDHNRIRTTDIRILRRLVRDYMTRNASMEHTLGMWASVRRGEEKWIFPYQENADALFNTTLLYEVSVLKKYVYPLLEEVPPESKYYAMARDIVKFLNYILDADIEDEIPPTSILREFIGGNTYYR